MLPPSRQLTPLEAEHFRKFRLQAVIYQPYLAGALFSLIPVRSPELGTFAIDRYGRVYLDPEQFNEWTVQECAAVLIHEVHHLLRRHAERADDLKVPNHLQDQWNIAADLAINDDLVAQDLPLPDPLLPTHFEFPDGKSEELYFNELQKLDDPNSRCACGSGSGGAAHDELDEAAADSLGPTDLARIRADVLDKMRRSAKGSPNLRTALMSRPPAAPWQNLLRRLLRPKLSVSGDRRSTWDRPNRRHDSTFLFPGSNRRAANVGIVFDTSASMSQDLLNRAASEVAGILRSARIRTLTLVSCDEEASIPAAIAPTSTLSLVGGGGTDLTFGIHALANLAEPPSVIIVLTDGWTPWPEVAPKDIRLVCAIFDPNARLPTGRGIEALYVS